ncbi:MAG: YHS domain-containing (seleno)protein [Thermoanaerobaculum sp.]
MKSTRLLVILGLVAVLGVALWAGEARKPALKGYCPVCYQAVGKAVEGKPELATEFQGQTFYLANADVKKMFEAEPAKYVPAYNGYCATAMAQGKKLEANPKLFAVKNGRTFLFSSREAKAMFEKDPEGTIAQADAQWTKLQKQAEE